MTIEWVDKRTRAFQVYGEVLSEQRYLQDFHFIETTLDWEADSTQQKFPIEFIEPIARDE